MGLRKDNPGGESCPKNSGKRGFSLPFVSSISPMPPTKPPRKEAEAEHAPEKVQADPFTTKDNHILEGGVYHDVSK